MPLSGAARTSFRIVADSPSRCAAVSASRLVDAIPKQNRTLRIRRMFDTPTDDVIATGVLFLPRGHEVSYKRT